MGIVLILSAGVLGWWIAQPALETKDVSTPMKLDDSTTSANVPTPSVNNATLVSENLDPIRNSEVPIPTTRTPSETHENPTATTSVLATSTSSHADTTPEPTTVATPPTAQLKRTQTSLDPVVIPIDNDPILVSFILNSDPWGAAVSINGQPLGTTPITNRQLPAGRHSIEFVYQGIHSTHEVQIIEGRDNHFKWTSSTQELRILQGRGQ